MKQNLISRVVVFVCFSEAILAIYQALLGDLARDGD